MLVTRFTGSQFRCLIVISRFGPGYTDRSRSHRLWFDRNHNGLVIEQRFGQTHTGSHLYRLLLNFLVQDVMQVAETLVEYHQWRAPPNQGRASAT